LHRFPPWSGWRRPAVALLVALTPQHAPPSVATAPLERGTRITLHLKEEATEFATSDRLSGLIKTYSEFINFPIKVWKERQVPRQEADAEATEAARAEAKAKAEAKGEEFDVTTIAEITKTVFDEVQAFEVQNENKPLWVKPPKEVTDEQYDEFFKATFKEFMAPAAHSHFAVEGDIEFRSILYVPGMAPFDPNQDMNAAKLQNIKLFVKRVFISDEFGEDLMPRYLSFVKGVVDSSDLPLNVSREILQVSAANPSPNPSAARAKRWPAAWRACSAPRRTPESPRPSNSKACSSPTCRRAASCA
jgi:heat shock protein beta